MSQNTLQHLTITSSAKYVNRPKCRAVKLGFIEIWFDDGWRQENRMSRGWEEWRLRLVWQTESDRMADSLSSGE